MTTNQCPMCGHDELERQEVLAILKKFDDMRANAEIVLEMRKMQGISASTMTCTAIAASDLYRKMIKQ